MATSTGASAGCTLRRFFRQSGVIRIGPGQPNSLSEETSRATNRDRARFSRARSLRITSPSSRLPDSKSSCKPIGRAHGKTVGNTKSATTCRGSYGNGGIPADGAPDRPTGALVRGSCERLRNKHSRIGPLRLYSRPRESILETLRILQRLLRLARREKKRALEQLKQAA